MAKVSPNLALQIPHLTHLNLSYNVLMEVPQSIGLLFHLEELLLRGNKIAHIPDEICVLSNLQMLDLSHNNLSSLPQDMGRLRNLVRLNVSHNMLTAIPYSLGSNFKLLVLLATFNQSVEPPQYICDSSEQLLSYLRKQACPVLTEELLNYFPRVRSNIAYSTLEDTARTEYVKIQTQTCKPASRTKTPLLLPANATRCSPETLGDKILGNNLFLFNEIESLYRNESLLNDMLLAGLIYGAVLGDSLGVATEYLPLGEIDFYYADGRLNHHSFVQDEHRVHFLEGRTTCVSDFIVS